ncbi:fungal-specific transcription factor domain-containing protein [Aspergillus insuetus]
MEKHRQRLQRSRRARGLTCANCRARKVRCEGGQPTCKTCEIYNEECRYDKPPSMSDFLAMAKRLENAEKELAEMRASVNRSTHLQGNHHDVHSPSPDSPVNAHQPHMSHGTSAGPSDTISTRLPQQTQANREAPVRQLTSNDPIPTELSVDEHGKICYYGPTSAVHDPPHVDSQASQAVTTSSTSSTRADAHNFLSAYGKESATWEEFALGNASLETGIPRHIMARLLHLYWTWVSPMFMWVYRPAFVRDMATGGRYYSDFLLTVICAHAAKYQDGNCAELLLTRARRLLGTAIQQPSSIPTIQALLQLSARDLAHGSISQAWVYSGIAFRMASDLGLQHTGPGIKGMSPVDLEVRWRLFWSCYFWDKATSLYAGRLPAVTEALNQDTLDMLDDSTELETWSPYYKDSLNLTKLTHSQYPSMKSHSVACFANSCRLSIIINDIIVQLYSRRSRAITEAALHDIKMRLESWRANSPSHLRFDPDNLPSICPPPHIISQNLLYYASAILAHRPFWSAVPAYYQICITAAQSIEKLILLLESTFGLENITYLMGYCIYTGASAILDDAKNGRGTGSVVLRTFLRALNTGMRRCPLLERSLNIIVKELNRPSAVPTASSSANSNPASAKPVQQSLEQHQDPNLNLALNLATGNGGYIPAFPYLGSSPLPADLDLNTSMNGITMDSMARLDCFPEMQMNMGELIWLN